MFKQYDISKTKTNKFSPDCIRVENMKKTGNWKFPQSLTRAATMILTEQSSENSGDGDWSLVVTFPVEESLDIVHGLGPRFDSRILLMMS